MRDMPRVPPEDTVSQDLMNPAAPQEEQAISSFTSEILKERPQAMELLEAALRENHVQYRLTQARGGTDGAQMSLRGLPTPNIFAGYENPHGPYEWLSMGWVEKTFHILETIVKNAVK